MKTFLTISEYRKRLKDNIIQHLQQGVTPYMKDYVKIFLIRALVTESLTYHIAFKDECNQLFFNVFGKDKNGNIITTDILKNLPEEEFEEFMQQPEFIKFKEECKKQYRPTFVLIKSIKLDMFDFYRVVLQIFEKEPICILADEIFKECYGYEFEWKFE